MRLNYEPTAEELEAFWDLQSAFHALIFLIHFDGKRCLYVDVDASKA